MLEILSYLRGGRKVSGVQPVSFYKTFFIRIKYFVIFIPYVNMGLRTNSTFQKMSKGRLQKKKEFGISGKARAPEHSGEFH